MKLNTKNNRRKFVLVASRLDHLCAMSKEVGSTQKCSERRFITIKIALLETGQTSGKVKKHLCRCTEEFKKDPSVCEIKKECILNYMICKL